MADASAPDIELTEDDKDLLTALHPSSLAAAARECVAAASSSAAAAAAPAAAAPARPAAAAAASSAKALLAASAAPVSRRDEKIAALRVASGVASREEVESADLKHKFWSTQPVPRLAEQVKDHGAIEPLRTLADVNPEAYALPPGFEWCCIDVTSEIEMNETYELLANNYVEDDDAMFRFAYPLPFLRWALTPPHFFPEWHVGVRLSGKSRRLVACITGVPAVVEVYGHMRHVCEINYLCVDKKLRSKRLAPVLIREITRRVNLRGMWQAVYTAGVVLPKPVTSCRYWHRSIKPKKLIEVGFSRLQPRMTMQRTERLYKLADKPSSALIRPLTPSDVPSAALLLNESLGAYALRPVLSLEDVAHWLLPRKDVIDCFVISKRVPRKQAVAAARAAAERIAARTRKWLAENPSVSAEGAVAGAAAAAAAVDSVEGSLGGGTRGDAGAAASAAASVGESAAGGAAAAAGGEAAAGGAAAAAGGAAAAAGGEAAAWSPTPWYDEAALAVGAAASSDEEVVDVVTDIVSFYHLPSTVINSKEGHTHLYAAYLYYYAATSVPLRSLLEDALILARDAGIDVFNCLDLMDNQPHLEPLKFGIGDGNLQYYLFNWACPSMKPGQVGLVLH